MVHWVGAVAVLWSTAGLVPEEAKPTEAHAEDKAAPASDVPELSFQKSVLDNGLEVIVHQDARLPVVCVSVWYHVGAFHEEKGKTGFAHLFEHLMFQGTPHAPGDAHFRLLEAAGGSFINGTTDFDRTNYFECVPKNEVELALWLESSRMGWLMLAVDQAKLDEQRNVVKNERRQGVENVPYGLAEERLWQSLFPAEHPYYGYVIGSMEDLDRASLSDVSRFYDNYYAPSNATLTLAGDIDAAAAKELVDKYFKTLPKWPKPPAREMAAPALANELRLDLEDRAAQVPKVSVSMLVPPAFSEHDADIAVLARVLGDGNGSRLHQALIVDAPLAQSVSADHQRMQNVSVLTLSAVVRPGVNPDDVLDAIQSQIEALIDFPPSGEEIARAVTRFESEQVFALQLPLRRAEMLQYYNHYKGDPAYLAQDVARYRAVTTDSALAAITAFFPKEKRALMIAKPAAAPATAKEGS